MPSRDGLSLKVTHRLVFQGEVAGPEETDVGPRTLADAIRDRLQVDDDNNDQAILARVTGMVGPHPLSLSRAHLAATKMPLSGLIPALVSPTAAIPSSHFGNMGLIHNVPHPYQSHSRPSHYPRHGRKDKLNFTTLVATWSQASLSQYRILPMTGRLGFRSRTFILRVVSYSHSIEFEPFCDWQCSIYQDVFSTFSSDSGNVHDFPEGSEHKLYLPKSKSMPEYPGDPQKQDLHSLTGTGPALFLLASCSLSGHDGRYRQSREVSRRSSSSKKTLTDLTDSGVSMVSGSTPTLHPPAAPCKDSRVLSWLLESEKQGGPSGPHSHSDKDKHRLRAGTATSPIATRHSRKPVVPYTGSRSGSLERSSGTVSWGGTGPAQPFVADPCMPPLPLPHTPTQLEEARRRLLEEEGRARSSRQRAACDPFLKCKLAFCKTIADECQPFLQRFQTSKPMTPYLFEAVEKLLRYLMNRCVKPDLMKCTGPKLLSIDTKKSENLILSKNIDIGFATKRLLGETAITVTERQKLEFIHECRSMLTTMIAKLQEKSPLKQKAVRGLSSLDPCVIQHSPQLAQKRFSFLLEELNHANIINDVLAENAKKEYLHFCNLKKSELQEIFRPCDQFSDEVGLDTIYGSFLIGEANYKHLWEVIKICLVLSHGNATVEGGFSVNKSLLVENMHEKTVIAQRHIHDEIQEAGGIKNIHISKKMLDYVRGARKRYHEYLEMKKQEKSEKDKKKAEKRKLDIQVKDLEGERKKLMMATEEKREAIDVELQELKKKQASLY
uniref:Uncharacterized protein n=1 Tax=Timema monikensis TaxID=170555 RepID=A0A7R9EFT5_9NEOP|nr:unnamed protein product [Timema monikensis]